MKGFILAVAAGAIAFVLMLQILPESMIAFAGETPQLILLALFVGVVNAVVKPIVNLLSIPISFLTLGLAGFVINAALLLGIAYLAQNFAKLDLTIGGWPTSGMTADTILGAVVASLVLSRDHDGGRARRPRLTGVADATSPAEALIRAARRFGTPVARHVRRRAGRRRARARGGLPGPLAAGVLAQGQRRAGRGRPTRRRGAGRERRLLGRVGRRPGGGAAERRITLEGVGKSAADLRAAVRACADGQPAALGGRGEPRGAGCAGGDGGPGGARARGGRRRRSTSCCG